jgi:hypothetical protein
MIKGRKGALSAPVKKRFVQPLRLLWAQHIAAKFGKVLDIALIWLGHPVDQVEQNAQDLCVASVNAA